MNLEKKLFKINSLLTEAYVLWNGITEKEKKKYGIKTDFVHQALNESTRLNKDFIQKKKEMPEDSVSRFTKIISYTKTGKKPIPVLGSGLKRMVDDILNDKNAEWLPRLIEKKDFERFKATYIDNEFPISNNQLYFVFWGKNEEVGDCLVCKKYVNK